MTHKRRILSIQDNPFVLAKQDNFYYKEQAKWVLENIGSYSEDYAKVMFGSGIVDLIDELNTIVKSDEPQAKLLNEDLNNFLTTMGEHLELIASRKYPRAFLEEELNEHHLNYLISVAEFSLTNEDEQSVCNLAIMELLRDVEELSGLVDLFEPSKATGFVEPHPALSKLVDYFCADKTITVQVKAFDRNLARHLNVVEGRNLTPQQVLTIINLPEELVPQALNVEEFPSVSFKYEASSIQSIKQAIVEDVRLLTEKDRIELDSLTTPNKEIKELAIKILKNVKHNYLTYTNHPEELEYIVDLCQSFVDTDAPQIYSNKSAEDILDSIRRALQRGNSTARTLAKVGVTVNPPISRVVLDLNKIKSLLTPEVIADNFYDKEWIILRDVRDYLAYLRGELEGSPYNLTHEVGNSEAIDLALHLYEAVTSNNKNIHKIRDAFSVDRISSSSSVKETNVFQS